MSRDSRFIEAAMREVAQGDYAKNESLAFAALPEFLMEESEWAWKAGYDAGRSDAKRDPRDGTDWAHVG